MLLWEINIHKTIAGHIMAWTELEDGSSLTEQINVVAGAEDEGEGGSGNTRSIGRGSPDSYTTADMRHNMYFYKQTFEKAYSKKDGPEKFVANAIKAGTNVICFGENHSDFVGSISKLASIVTHNPNKIAYITLEVPVEVNAVFDKIRAGQISLADYEASLGANTQSFARARAVYSLVKLADKVGTKVVAADKGSMGLVAKPDPTKADYSERLDDSATFDYLEKQGYISKNMTTIVVQGSSHLTNAGGALTPGVDDLAAKNGYSTLTMVYHSSKQVAAEISYLTTTNTIDPPDMTFVGNKAYVGQTTLKTATDSGYDGTPVRDIAYNEHIAFANAKQVSTSQVTGNNKDEIFIMGNGVQTVNGGGGADYVSYRNSTSGLTVDLATPSLNTGAAKGDKYISIENIFGSMHDDRLYGDAAANTINGSAGNDVLYGRDGNDTLYGDTGSDILNGGNNNDTLYGGTGNDTLYGGAHNDVLYGEEGADTLYGEDGNDVLWGGIDNDRLYGGNGNDTLWGNDGNDMLQGGAGNDRLHGGPGNDTYVFGKTDGSDIIDFQNDRDMIYLRSDDRGAAFGKAQVGNDVRITWGSTQILVLDTKLKHIDAKSVDGGTGWEIS